MTLETQYAIRNTQYATLIVVTGHPGAGKTRLAAGLGRELGLPVLGRDGLKEIMFDGLGWSDRDWSRRLGSVSYDLLYYVAEAMLRGGASLIVESNFDPLHGGPVLARLVEEAGSRVVQVLCHAEGHVLVERYLRRAGSAERHAGHVDHVGAQELEQRVRDAPYPLLPLPGPLVVVDTTDFTDADPARVAAQVRELLAPII